MSVKGYQDFWLAGSRMMIIRDDDTNESLLDIGVIQSATPTIETESAELFDPDGGVRVKVDEGLVSINEQYEVVCSNLNLDNLALFYLSVEPSALAAIDPGDLVDVEHAAVLGAGRFVKLKDANGNFLYNVASITGLIGTTALVENVHYEWPSQGKLRGFIRILPGAGISNGDPLDLTITLTAVTGNRVIYPLSKKASVPGRIFLSFSREGFARDTMREFRGTISPSGSAVQVEEFSSLTFTVTVLSEITEVNPAGRMIQTNGTLPA